MEFFQSEYSRMENYFSPGGFLEKAFPGYELRPQQQQMAQHVRQALLKKSKLLVEAGTGVGKSFAYLIPALIHVLEKKEGPVVVSTHTISLQEQLITKDIPALSKIVPFPFKVALVKGRGNYLSLRRLRVAQKKAFTLLGSEDSLQDLHDLGRWSLNTSDGSLSDLDWEVPSHVWELVQSDSGNCMGRSCKDFGRCFYYQARKGINQADILVVNHALFFADLVARKGGAGILPDYSAAILDEAHTLEDAAVDQFGDKFGEGTFQYFFDRILSQGRKEKGLLAQQDFPISRERLSSLRAATEIFFLNLQNRFQQLLAGTGNLSPENRSVRVREKGLVEDNVSEEFKLLSSSLEEESRNLPEEERMEVLALSDRAADYALRVDDWLGQANAGHVHWMEISGKKTPRLNLCSAPVDVSGVLRDSLFEKSFPVILTSATLSTGGTGGHKSICARLGIDKAEFLELQSPFDFQKQAQLYLYASMPDPATRAREFEDASLSRILQSLEKSNGRAFILFTSYQYMQRMAKALEPWCSQRGYPLIVQGQGLPRNKMVQLFREENNPVLLGVDSFWQGVDVQGETLSNVIITRLPFVVPDLPLTQARQEFIEENGGNPFFDYQIPQAILKLKQGVGRLIRSTTDRGTVLILDPRVITKPYGKSFLKALPKFRTFVDGKELDGSSHHS